MTIQKSIIVGSSGGDFLPRFGALVETFNAIEVDQAAYTDNMNDILNRWVASSEISTSNRWTDTVGDLEKERNQHRSAMNGWKSLLLRRGRETLISTARKYLEVPVQSPQDAVEEIGVAMRSTGATVDANTVAYSSVTSATSTKITATGVSFSMASGGWTYGGHADGTGNTGRSHIFVSPNSQYLTGIPTNEGLISEAATVRCVADKDTGAAAGLERFGVLSIPARPSPEVYSSRYGAGGNTFLTVAGNGGVLTNGNFETLSTNCPASWDIENTAAVVEGTHILQSTDVTFRTGGNSLKFLGSSGDVPISVRQTVSLTPGVYHAALEVLANTDSPDTDVRFGLWNVDACGWYANALSATCAVAVTAGQFSSTDFSLKTGIWEVTSPVPTLAFRIATTEQGGGGVDLGAAEALYFGEATLQRPARYNGLWWSIFRGTVDPIVDDQAEIRFVNQREGAFQTFFTRAWGRQLPSATGGTETISDSHAE